MLLGSSIDRLNKLGSGQREEDYYNKISEIYEVQIFEYSDKKVDAIKYENINFIKNKWINSLFGPFLYFLFYKRPSIIRTKQLWGTWAAWIIKILLRAPLVVRCGYIWSKSFEIERKGIWKRGKSIPGIIEKMLIKCGDGYIFCSKEIHDFYKPYTGDKKCVIIPNTYNLDFFYPKEKIEKKYDFIYVGRLIPLKGFDKMLSLIPRGKSLLVIGEGELKSLIKQNKNFYYIQSLKNYSLPKYFRLSRFYISMSLTEGNPKATYEAVLCGCYPILSNIAAHRELVDTLGYGLLIEKNQIVLNIRELEIDKKKLKTFSDKYSIRNGINEETKFMKTFLS